AAADFFRVERWRGPGAWDAGYAVVVVTAGDGVLSGASGVLPVEAGQTWLVPYAAGPLRLHGQVEVLRCRPPV
ncbi:MAG: carbohydrate kinase, partial [Actinobacteria bacterium]|nr:carbohydrate kinase [Actinomycetota bacterium]